MVSTPIGNLEDISIRAIKTLQSVDFIICEDSRVTNKLLSKYGIKNKIFVYNDHSKEADREKITNHIKEGKAAALVSDAGTPLISDPGLKLVRSLKGKNIYITAVPGACAVISALVISGVDSDKFDFYGFLPVKKIDRMSILEEITSSSKSSIIYETAKKLVHLLNDVIEINPEQNIVIVREMTKLYEEVISDTAKNLLTKSFKGELVVIFPKNALGLSKTLVDDSIIKILKNLSTKDGQIILKKLYPEMKKNDLYNLLKN